jgi:adenylate cyclase
MLGCVLGFGGYREEALDRLRQAMRASPYYNNYHTALAAALAYQGHLDEARGVLSRAPPVDPRYQLAPWLRPEDIELRGEGFRLAAGDSNSSARESAKQANLSDGGA